MNILFVTAHAPHPTHTGSGQRSNLIYNSLKSLGSVKTITLESESAFTDEEMEVLRSRYNLIGTGPVTALGSQGLWKLAQKFHPNLANSLSHNLDGSKSRFKPDSLLIKKLEIEEVLKNTDLIVGRYTHALTRLNLLNTGIPTILDVDDLASDIYKSRLEKSSNNLFEKSVLKWHYHNIKKQEPAVFNRIDAHWICNLDNLDSDGLNSASYLPNIPFSYSDSDFNSDEITADNLNVACIASYKHRPNSEGIYWFLQNVWQQVIQDMPSAKFQIYGSGLSDKQTSDWSSYKNVSVEGFVQEAKYAYQNSALMICPVQEGAGTNIKVLESGANKRNCILSNAASRGLRKDPELFKSLIISTDPQDMASRIVHLLQNPEINRQSAEVFNRTVLEEYSFTKFQKRVLDTVTETLDNL